MNISSRWGQLDTVNAPTILKVKVITKSNYVKVLIFGIYFRCSPNYIASANFLRTCSLWCFGGGGYMLDSGKAFLSRYNSDSDSEIIYLDKNLQIIMKYFDMSWRFLLRPLSVAITKTTSWKVKIYNNFKPENSYIDIIGIAIEILSFWYQDTIMWYISY